MAYAQRRANIRSTSYRPVRPGVRWPALRSASALLFLLKSFLKPGRLPVVQRITTGPGNRIDTFCVLPKMPAKKKRKRQAITPITYWRLKVSLVKNFEVYQDLFEN